MMGFLAYLVVCIVRVPAQPVREYGDAPENATTHTAFGVTGAFPTSKNTGQAAWIQFNTSGAWYDPYFGFELEKNPGIYPVFDNDHVECYGNQDAGLLFPTTKTIITGPSGQIAIIPFFGQTVFPFGTICATALWGTCIEIIVRNTVPTQTKV